MRDTIKFLGQYLSKRGNIGSITPSSKRLAKAMLRTLGDIAEDEVIIELGPGTGAFTKFLRAKYPTQKILAIEFNDKFHESLKNKFPDIIFVNGCASHINCHLKSNGLSEYKIGGIISGLPLLSLPTTLCEDIIKSIKLVLPKDKKWVQFTYSKRAWAKKCPDEFKLDKTKRVFFNLPPAVVLPFVKE